jgi:hypothetical protein
VTSAAVAVVVSWKAADPSRRSNAAIGRAVGVSPEMVARWLTGAVPGPWYRELLSILLGDPRLAREDVWLEKAAAKTKADLWAAALERVREAKEEFNV